MYYISVGCSLAREIPNNRGEKNSLVIVLVRTVQGLALARQLTTSSDREAQTDFVIGILKLFLNINPSNFTIKTFCNFLCN